MSDSHTRCYVWLIYEMSGVTHEISCVTHMVRKCTLSNFLIYPMPNESIVTTLLGGRFEVLVSTGVKYLSLPQNVQTGWRPHPLSYLMANGVMRAGCDIDHSHRSNAELRNERSCTSAPLHVLMVCTGTFFKSRSQNCEKRMLALWCLSVRPSVCLRGTTGLPLNGFWRNFIFEVLFENLSRKFKFYLNLKWITSILHEDVFPIVAVSRRIHLQIINVLGRSCRANKSNFMFNIFFFSKDRVVYEIMWENMIEPSWRHVTM